MGSRRWLHAIGLVAIAGGIAAGQRPPLPLGHRPTPAPTPPSEVPGGAPGAGSAASTNALPPKPAGSSAVESNDVPPVQPSPPKFAVAPFENPQQIRAFDWLVAGAPFEIAEKSADVLGLEPTGGPLFVGGTVIESEPDQVAAFAAEHDAQWVITGVVDRPNWNLRIDLTLWKVANKAAIVVAQVARTGEPKAYHQVLGDALADTWSKAGIPVDLARRAKLQRSLATDLYAVNLMSRGLGHLTGALGKIDLKDSLHDMERAVFIDPKCPEAQRLLGELYLAMAPGDPRAIARAAGKFAYANDLAPDDSESLRAAATSAARAGKAEVAKDLFRRLVTKRPWDLEARYEYGAALWQTGDPSGAEKQLEQVTQKKPDHLAARRVLVLIHSSKSETKKLASELEAIQLRAPADIDIKADLATAYGAMNLWDKAANLLEQVVAVRPTSLVLTVRLADAKVHAHDLDSAVTWYMRAQKLAPDSSYPTFSAAQALYDAGRIPEATRWYLAAQRFPADLPYAEEALGALALIGNRPASDAAWYLRRAVRGAPRSVIAWRAEVAAELRRKDARYALMILDRALPVWPRDAELLYLAGVANAMEDYKVEARQYFLKAIESQPGHAGARAGLGALDVGGQVTLAFTPEIARPWGDAQAIDAALDRFAATAAAIAKVRASYQAKFTKLLGILGRGPDAPPKPPQYRACPVAKLAPAWSAARKELWHYVELGSDLEGAYRFVAKHEDIGAVAALMPAARAQVAQAKKTFRTALADIGELRAEWVRGLGPELRVAGCFDKLLEAAASDPEHYKIIEEDRPESIPTQQPPRPKPRATFYIDNTKCPDPVDVWIDGVQIGQVAPGRRSALVSDGGERSLCLIVPGAPQCGDKGTVRQVYLHDGWAATMHCPK